MKAKAKIWKMNEKILTGVFVFAFAVHIYPQSYQLDLSNSATYSTTCGTVNSAQWTVKNDSCILYTPELIVHGTSLQVYASYLIKINQSGNLSSSERAYVQHQINAGTWTTDTIVYGAGAPAVATLNDSILLDTGSVLRFRVTLRSTASNHFWSIKNGEISVNNATIKGEGSLPITLVDFYGRQLGNSIKINWTTASETNNEYFVIERSSDNVNFENISIIDGAGNSTILLDYSFTDSEPLNATGYYRIKQVDFNGEYTYSNPISVSFKAEENVTFINDIYNNNCGIQITSSTSHNANLSVFSITGAKVYGQTINITEGTSMFNISNQVSKGTYIIILQTADSKYSFKTTL